MSESTSAEDDISFNSSDVNTMIALSNFFAHKGVPDFFRSKLDIARRFESFPNAHHRSAVRVDIPSKTLSRLVDKMMYAGFIQINDSNSYFFDEDKFKVFIRREHPDGVEWWNYIDRLVDYIE